MVADSSREFPKAILHVDGDAFFVSCEVACNPGLRGKPVVTGAERRIASALSYEAKALGVKRGMPIYQIRQLFPQVIVIPSHYRLYEIFSQRMYRILSRFTTAVEWYSIDECFADITGLDVELGLSYEEIATKIQHTLNTELGITFSLGLSVSKVLAKVASKWQKPAGQTIIPFSQIERYTKETPLGKVWGVGSQTNRYLAGFGLKTAADFVNKGETWVTEHCPKPIVEIWHELAGRTLYHVHAERREKHKSLSSTETFMPPTADPAFLFSELSRHVEDVARSARREASAATHVSFFLKTRDFRYRRVECILPSPTAMPSEILQAVRQAFGSVYDRDFVYRATGVTLFGLVPLSHVSRSLFSEIGGAGGTDGAGEMSKTDAAQKVYKIVDEMIDRYGSRALYVCSSLLALGTRKKKPKFFSIPILGKVS